MIDDLKRAMAAVEFNSGSTDFESPVSRMVIEANTPLKYSALLMSYMYEALVKLDLKTIPEFEKFYTIAKIAWNMAVLRQQGYITKDDFKHYISGNAKEVFLEHKRLFESLINDKIRRYAPNMGIIRSLSIRKEGDMHFVKVIFTHKNQKAYEAEVKYGWPVMM